MIKRTRMKTFFCFGLLFCTATVLFGCQLAKNLSDLDIAEENGVLPSLDTQETAASTKPSGRPASSMHPSPHPTESPLPPPIDTEGKTYILVYKEERILQLWKGEEVIGEYDIALGFQPIGHKEIEGDGKTPEGVYYLCVKNPNSNYYLSLGVSYPGIPDAQKGLETGRITQREHDSIVRAINSGGIPPWNTALGGQIMIHGSGSHRDWTAGCIAVENHIMDILWEHCSIGTQIVIYP